MLRRSLPALLLAALALTPAAASAAPTQLETSPSSQASESAPALLRKAEAVNTGRAPARADDYTMLLKELAVKLPRLSGGQRTRARDLLQRPTQDDSVATADPHRFSVPEEPPICSEHFCVHYVASTKDAPASTDYIQAVNGVFEYVYSVENDQMGWKAPKSDGSRGCPSNDPSCMNKTDVYLLDIGGDGLYGYAAPDASQRHSSQRYAYLVVDNDFSEPVFTQAYSNPLLPLEVTAAHEYNHVLQYAYSVRQETWMYEASASWVENEVYPAINDYFQYLKSWAGLTTLPLTNEVDSSSQYNGKTYGNAVYNQWIDNTLGQEAIRGAWENTLKVRPRYLSPAAYDVSLRSRGSSYFDAFTSFAADTAEWRASNSPFDADDRADFPEVRRVRASGGGAFELVANHGGGVATLLHSSYALINVRRTSAPALRIVGNLPRGARGAIAVTGRTGNAVDGQYVVRMRRLPRGGTGTVTLANPSQYTRITAAMINGDSRVNGSGDFDWDWIGDRDTDGDGVEDTGPAFSAMASTDFSAPSLEHRSPGRGKHGVARGSGVKVRFSERMAFANARTAVLRGPGSRKVAVTVHASGRQLEIRPRSELRPRTRYTVKLSRDITDRGGNPLPAGSRAWTFTTGR